MRFAPIIAAVSTVAYAGTVQVRGEPALSPYSAYKAPAPPAPPAKPAPPPANDSKVQLYGQW